MRKKSALAALFVSAAMIAGACGGGASIVGSYKPGEGGTGGTLLVGDVGVKGLFSFILSDYIFSKSSEFN